MDPSSVDVSEVKRIRMDIRLADKVLDLRWVKFSRGQLGKGEPAYANLVPVRFVASAWLRALRQRAAEDDLNLMKILVGQMKRVVSPDILTHVGDVAHNRLDPNFLQAFAADGFRHGLSVGLAATRQDVEDIAFAAAHLDGQQASIADDESTDGAADEFHCARNVSSRDETAKLKSGALALPGGPHTVRLMRNWEQAYREENTPWDKGEPAPPLRAYLRDHRITGRVLVPGCGAGHDVRLLAAQGAEVTGLDLAPSAIARAESFAKAANERYAVADIFALPSEHHSTYDWVVEHTCLCALNPETRPAYVENVHRALKPEGNFLGIFYTLVEDYDGSGPPHPISPDEIDELFAGRFQTLEAWTPVETYASRTGGREQMRHMRRV